MVTWRSRSVSPMIGAAMSSLLLLLLTIFQLADVGHAQSPPEGTVKIKSFSYKGSGCPGLSAEGTVSNDQKALTIMFSKYTASTDPPQSNRRKNCAVSVELSYPSGFVFALADVTTRGYASLDDGVVGTIQTSYYIAGLPGTASAKRIVNGPLDDNFEFTDTFASAVYSACRVSRNLVLNSEVRVDPKKFVPPRTGLITIDSQDLELIQVFRLIWKGC